MHQRSPAVTISVPACLFYRPIAFSRHVKEIFIPFTAANNVFLHHKPHSDNGATRVCSKECKAGSQFGVGQPTDRVTLNDLQHLLLEKTTNPRPAFWASEGFFPRGGP